MVDHETTQSGILGASRAEHAGSPASMVAMTRDESAARERTIIDGRNHRRQRSNRLVVRPAERPRYSTMKVHLWVALLASLLACCRRAPTYRDDVAPILARRCVSCHGETGLAAFPRLDGSQPLTKVRD